MGTVFGLLGPNGAASRRRVLWRHDPGNPSRRAAPADSAGRQVPHATLSSPGALRPVAGTGLFTYVAGLFALGIATPVRHTAEATAPGSSS